MTTREAWSVNQVWRSLCDMEPLAYETFLRLARAFSHWQRENGYQEWP